MFEACIEMGFETEVDDDGVVVTVDVCVDAVEALEDLEDERAEGTWEWYTYCLHVRFMSVLSLVQIARTNARREHLLVVDVSLNPAHEMLNIFWCGHLRWLLELLVVLPQVLEFVRSLHLWAALRTAELCNGSIEEVDLVVEIDDYSCVSLRLNARSTISYH